MLNNESGGNPNYLDYYTANLLRLSLPSEIRPILPKPRFRLKVYRPNGIDIKHFSVWLYSPEGLMFVNFTSYKGTTNQYFIPI